MKCERGDILLVNYPFADGQGTKVRPALVVQCDSNNQRLHNTIVVQITSRTRFARSEPTQLLLEINSPVGRQSGLIFDSAVSCENIATVTQGSVIRKIGTLPASIMAQVDECLKAALSLN